MATFHFALSYAVRPGNWVPLAKIRAFAGKRVISCNTNKAGCSYMLGHVGTACFVIVKEKAVLFQIGVLTIHGFGSQLAQLHRSEYQRIAIQQQGLFKQ